MNIVIVHGQNHKGSTYRIARMLECDPLDLVVEEDLPVLKKKRKKRGAGDEP